MKILISFIIISTRYAKAIYHIRKFLKTIYNNCDGLNKSKFILKIISREGRDIDEGQKCDYQNRGTEAKKYAT